MGSNIVITKEQPQPTKDLSQNKKKTNKIAKPILKNIKSDKKIDSKKK